MSKYYRQNIALKIANSFLHADAPRIAVGDPASGAINASAVTVKRVVLRCWGLQRSCRARQSERQQRHVPNAGERICPPAVP